MSNEANVMVACELYYPFLTHKNQMAEKYTVDLACLSEAAVTALEDMGLSVNNKGDDRGYYITCKSKNKYKAFEIDGREIGLKGRTATSDTDDTESGVVVGNGSKAKCLVSYYDWEYNKKKGRSATLRRIVIEDLVEYSPSYEVENAL
jgi:hypothetical protein